MADELNDGGRSAAVHSGLAAQRMISSRDIRGDNKSIFIFGMKAMFIDCSKPQQES